jgi:hypothetical protein
LAKPLVGIDFIQPMAEEVVDDRAGHAGNVGPGAAANAVILQRGRNAGFRFEAVGRAARKHDGIDPWLAVTESQRVRHQRPGGAAADVHGCRRSLRKADDGHAGGACLIGRHPNLYGRPIKLQRRPGPIGRDRQVVLPGARRQRHHQRCEPGRGNRYRSVELHGPMITRLAPNASDVQACRSGLAQSGIRVLFQGWL